MWVKNFEVEGYKFEIQFSNGPVNPSCTLHLISNFYSFARSFSYVERTAPPEKIKTWVEDYIEEAKKFVEKIKVSEELANALASEGFVFINE